MLENFFIFLLTSLFGVTGNLGLSIIAMTLLIKGLILPISLPSIKAQKKMRDLSPQLNKLKKKFKSDNKALQQAQLELYKKYNVNPFSGCLPQVLMIVILIGLYRALNNFLGHGVVNGSLISTNFLWLDLTKPDPLYILPVITGVSQLIMSIMISPGGEVRDVVPNQSKKKSVQKENKEEEDMASMANTMQKQMIFLMPVMTAFIAIRLPSGLSVYWVVANLFSMAQQYVISGPGGLKIYWNRAKIFALQIIKN